MLISVRNERPGKNIEEAHGKKLLREEHHVEGNVEKDKAIFKHCRIFYFIFSKEKKTEKNNAVHEEIRTIRNRNIEHY